MVRRDPRSDGRRTEVVLDVDDLVDPDCATVDALARLQLAAQERGCEVRLRNASSALLELVELMGLTHVLAEGGFQPGREVEPQVHE